MHTCVFIGLTIVALLTTSVDVNGTKRFYRRQRWSRNSNCPSGTFTRTTGDIVVSESYSTPLDAGVYGCRNIETSVPTVIRSLSESPRCSYHVIAYSDVNCQDSAKLNSFLVSAYHNDAVLNEKQPICSYYVGGMLLPGQFIRIKFEGEVGMMTRALYRTGCYNLCNFAFGEEHPPEILETKTNVDSQGRTYIQLYSGGQCEDGTQLRYPNGTVVKSHLDETTEVSPIQPIRSYTIVSVS